MYAATFAPGTPLQNEKALANTHAAVARLLFKEWLNCHRKLFLLAQCARYEFFTKNPLQVNALILKDLRCKPLRECLQVVLKLQRELKKFEKKIKESVKKEKESDRRFWALANTMRQ